MRKLLIVLVTIFVIGIMGFVDPTEGAEEMKLFEFDVSGEAKLLYQPIDGTVDYGFGAKLFYVYDRVVYVGGVWVPGENLSTNEGDGREALYGPEIGIGLLEMANKAGVKVELPDLLKLDIGVAWLANLEGGIQFEKAPRITLVILQYDF